MATIVDCPSCSRKLRVPEEMLGRNVKCPKCGTTFAATSAGESDPPPSPPPPRDEEEEPVSRRSSVRDRPSSPGGKRDVDDEERSRRADREEEEPRRRRRDEDRRDEDRDEEYRRPRRSSRSERKRQPGEEPHRGVLVMVFGIISIACVLIGLIVSCVIGAATGFGIIVEFGFLIPGLGLGIPAWVMGGRDLRKMDIGKMDPDGRGMTMAGFVCGIVGTILNGLLLFCCTLMAIVVIGFGVALLSSVQDMENKQKNRPPGRFESTGSPLRLQDYLPGVRK